MQFLKRTLLKTDDNDDRERLHQLLKFGLSMNYWNEFASKETSTDHIKFNELQESVPESWVLMPVVARQPGTNEITRTFSRREENGGAESRKSNNRRQPRFSWLLRAAHVVCEWVGNSEAVAKQYYLEVTEDHMNRVEESSSTPAPHSEGPSSSPP